MTRFDEDQNDAQQHCEHGTFIGSWWGPDYLCGWCEDGISVEEMGKIQHAQRLYQAQKKVDDGTRIVDIVTGVMVDQRQPYNIQLAQSIVDTMLDPWQGYVQAYDLVNA